MRIILLMLSGCFIGMTLQAADSDVPPIEPFPDLDLSPQMLQKIIPQIDSSPDSPPYEQKEYVRLVLDLSGSDIDILD